MSSVAYAMCMGGACLRITSISYDRRQCRERRARRSCGPCLPRDRVETVGESDAPRPEVLDWQALPWRRSRPSMRIASRSTQASSGSARDRAIQEARLEALGAKGINKGPLQSPLAICLPPPEYEVEGRSSHCGLCAPPPPIRLEHPASHLCVARVRVVGCGVGDHRRPHHIAHSRP